MSTRLRVLVFLDDIVARDIDVQSDEVVVNVQNEIYETGLSPTHHTYDFTGRRTLTVTWQESEKERPA